MCRSADPMEGIQLKLGRAEEHVKDLEAQVRAYLARHPYRMRAEFERDTSEYVFRSELIEEPPAKWGVIIGDIAHNYRSVLDHIAWQLALLTTPTPTRRTQFPIAASEEEFKRDATRAMMRDISVPNRAIIERLQRYPTGDPHSLPPGLVALRELSNADKHRLLHTTLAAFSLAEGPKFEFTLVRDATGYGRTHVTWGGPIDGTEIARLELITSGPNPDVKMKWDMPVDVAFSKSDSPLSGRAVGDVLLFIGEAVRAVVMAFHSALGRLPPTVKG